MNVKLFYSPEGFGNVGYDFPANAAAGVLNAANDGLSTDLATGKIAQLGQAVGRAGDPATLLEDREIPANNFRLFYGRNNGIDNVIGFDQNLGIFVSNNTGRGIQFFWQIGINSNTFDILTDDAQNIRFDYFGQANITWNEQSIPGVSGKFFTDGAAWVMGSGEGVRITPVLSATSATYNVLTTDSVITADTTAGNLQINLNPAVVGFQRITVKKISVDLNTVTIAPTSGTIQELGPAAATFVFNVQGQSVTIVNNTVNFFII